jgi:long-chain acyl-CoA synthetase
MKYQMELTEKTLNSVIETVAQKFPRNPVVSMAFEKPLTYGEFFESIVSTADMLEKRGIVKGDRIAILGENSPNWGISYFASVRIGAVVVPILPDFPEADIRHILVDSEARILFTTQRQVEKIAGIEAPQLESVIMLDDFKVDNEFLNIEPFSNLLKKAFDFILKIPDMIGLKNHQVFENDLASIIYTSGTSGHSKAVMLTHKNFVSDAFSTNALLDIHTDWTFLSVLPLSHAYEFTLGFILPIINGARIVYVGKAPTPTVLEKICQAEKPTAICAVPLIMEKIYKKKVLAAFEKSRFLRMARGVPFLRQRIYEKIGKKLLHFFGGKLKIMAIGGAAINMETERFLRKSKFPYLIGYGLTETAPLICGGPQNDTAIDVGSTGKPIPGVEIKIVAPDPVSGIGEIVARGANIMKGYYQNPKATRETIDEQGWLNTGDLGYFDRRGNLHIKGRSKNMILMSNGENIYPEAIEDKFNGNVYVVESLVIEDQGQLEARVYLDYDLIESETQGKSEQQRRAYIEETLEKMKSTINPQLPSFSQVSRVIEKKEPFEKTATSKIKRYLYVH